MQDNTKKAESVKVGIPLPALTIRLPTEEFDLIRAIAQKEDRPIAYIARNFLRIGMQQIQSESESEA